MITPLRDRLAEIMADAWPLTDQPPWEGATETERDYWREIADALLASEEWHARDADVARLRALLPHRRWLEMILAQPTGYWFDDEKLREWAQRVLTEHIRLDAAKGKEPDNATDRPA